MTSLRFFGFSMKIFHFANTQSHNPFSGCCVVKQGSSQAKMLENGHKVALITGITGQDGSYLAELLLAKGYYVSLGIRFSVGQKWLAQ